MLATANTPGCWKWIDYRCSSLTIKWLRVCCYVSCASVPKWNYHTSTQFGIVETSWDHVWCCHCLAPLPYFISLVIDMESTLSFCTSHISMAPFGLPRNRIVRLVFSAGTVFFSHNNSDRTMFFSQYIYLSWIGIMPQNIFLAYHTMWFQRIGWTAEDKVYKFTWSLPV